MNSVACFFVASGHSQSNFGCVLFVTLMGLLRLINVWQEHNGTYAWFHIEIQDFGDLLGSLQRFGPK